MTNDATPTAEDKPGLVQMRMAVERGLGDLGVWKHIGMELIEVGPGTATVELVPGEELSNTAGSVHGGIIATMLDAALACAVHTELPENTGVATIDLTTSYVRPALVSSATLRGVGTVIRVGRRVAQARGEVLDDQDQVVATAIASFTIVGRNYDEL